MVNHAERAILCAGLQTKVKVTVSECLAQADASIVWLTRSWQRGTNLTLAPLPGAVTCARYHARLVLAEWGLARLAQDAELVVSELVTNAVMYGTGDYVRVLLRTDGQQVAIMVWDNSFILPMPAEPDVDAPDGRGLAIVDALSARWGSYRTQGDGKIVWAVLAP